MNFDFCQIQLFAIFGCWCVISINLMGTHQVPLLVPHGIIKQLVHGTVPALSEGRSLIPTFLVLLLCPQHLHTRRKWHVWVTWLFSKSDGGLGGSRMSYEEASHPIVLRQAPGDMVGTSFHSARMISVFEQEMVLQGPNLWRGRHQSGWTESAGNDLIISHLVPTACRMRL